MKLLKSLLAASLLIVTATSLTACTDEEFAFGTGVVIGVIIGDDGGHHHHHPNPPRYRGRGRWHSESALAVLSPAEHVALKYDLSIAQAEILTSHLIAAREGDMSAMATLGFDRADLEALYMGKNPSASTLMTLSQILGLDMAAAHDLVQNMKADALVAKDSLM